MLPVGRGMSARRPTRRPARASAGPTVSFIPVLAFDVIVVAVATTGFSTKTFPAKAPRGILIRACDIASARFVSHVTDLVFRRDSGGERDGILSDPPGHLSSADYSNRAAAEIFSRRRFAQVNKPIKMAVPSGGKIFRAPRTTEKAARIYLLSGFWRPTSETDLIGPSVTKSFV